MSVILYVLAIYICSIYNYNLEEHDGAGLGSLNSLSELLCKSASAGTSTCQHGCNKVALSGFRRDLHTNVAQRLLGLLAQSAITRSLHLSVLTRSQQRDNRAIGTNNQPQLQTMERSKMLMCIGTSSVRPQQRCALRSSHSSKHSSICSKICRYTIWRPRLLHGHCTTVFVGQWMVESSLRPCVLFHRESHNTLSFQACPSGFEERVAENAWSQVPTTHRKQENAWLDVHAPVWMACCCCFFQPRMRLMVVTLHADSSGSKHAVNAQLFTCIADLHNNIYIVEFTSASPSQCNLAENCCVPCSGIDLFLCSS